jgi:uncharacterized membrane protein YidH (DUF202 family)
MYRIPQIFGERYYLAWNVVSACILAVAIQNAEAASEQADTKPNMRVLAQYLLLMGALSIILLGLVLVWPNLLRTFTSTQAFDTNISFAGLRSERFAPALAMLAFSVALVGAVRLHTRTEDVRSNAIAKYLMLAIIGHASLLMSSAGYDSFWWFSHVLTLSALLLALIKLGGELGACYAGACARIEYLEAVHQVSTRLSRSLELDRVLMTLVEDAAEMLGARFAAIMLADDSAETLLTLATHGIVAEGEAAVYQPQQLSGAGRPGFYTGHTARAFKNRRIVTVEDVYTDVEFMPWRILAGHDGYTVSIPLIHHDTAIGVMNLFFDAGIPLNEERLRLFQTIASSGSVAIMNAQLYGSVSSTGSPALEMAHMPSDLRLAS